jgi:hypothetical protein
VNSPPQMVQYCTNVGIADWAGAFGDATVATAMLDRLLHRAAVVWASTGVPTGCAINRPRPTGASFASLS